MRSQWECFLENLGEWQGSFTQLSPKGELIQNIPTVVKFEGLKEDQKIRQVIKYLQANQAIEEHILEYNTLGRGVLFFENGAFSQGKTQWGPYSEFGAELGLINSKERLRLIQLFNQDSQLERLTLIREKLAGTDKPQRPHLSIEQLLGEWQGEAITIYPDLRTPEKYSMSLKLFIEHNDRLAQELIFGNRKLKSTASINDNIICFDQSAPKVQVLLLPDGASATSPLQIKPRESFFLEVGWLINPHLRQRLIRRYSDKGDWVNLTLVTEYKVN